MSINGTKLLKVYYFTLYYLHDIRDPVEKYYLNGFSDTSNSAYTAFVYIKAVTKYESINAIFVTHSWE